MNDKLMRMLNSIGKKCFVDYYYDFKSNSSFDTLPIEYTDKSKKSRQSHSNWIFNNNLEFSALEICSRANIDQVTKNKAIKIISSEK